ncbi:unnamed protein product [Allacma fusca]|uniref:Uncharacterized protein n=1 Tax=Allacma fusca TaxID=39272 RepID=A0A8J2KRL6_9HEXA|nr:unnamed protein product [Allacma fusca]
MVIYFLPVQRSWNECHYEYCSQRITEFVPIQRPHLDGVFAAVVRGCLLKLCNAFAGYASTTRLPRRIMKESVQMRGQWTENNNENNRLELITVKGKNQKHRGRIRIFNRAGLPPLVNYTSHPSSNQNSSSQS